MSQLRKDPIVGRWTIIATELARWPAAFVDPQSSITAQSSVLFVRILPLGNL